MADQKFKIEITAADRASAVINKIGASVAKFTKPLTDAHDTLTALGKNTGLDKLTKSLGRAGGAAVAAVERLGVLGETTAGLAGIGSIGGVALLARRWADAGTQVTLGAYRIGIGTRELTQFQSAARLAGISGDVATQGASAMAKNIGDVLSGRSPEMAGYFAQLGIRARYTADGMADVKTAYQDLAAALARSPTAQGKNNILNLLGQPEDMRRLIENMSDLSDQAARLRPNAGAAADAGDELDKSLRKLGESAGGLGDTMKLNLLPGMRSIGNELNALSAKANEFVKSHPWLGHLMTVGAGALSGAAVGAAGGAVLGAFAGGVGAAPGALGGAIVGGVRGAAIAGGIDLLGHMGSSEGVPESQGRSVVLGLSGANIGIRSPGNLRVPGGTAFRRFNSQDEGLAADAANLIGYQTRHGIRTIAGISSRWAPANENDTEGNIRKISEASGFLPNEELDLRDPNTAAAVLSGIVRQQEGNQRITADQIAQAVATALREAGIGGGAGEIHVHAPSGTTVTQRGEDYWPVRLHYPLPNGANP